jgi:phosphatidylserine decarboxylase
MHLLQTIKDVVLIPIHPKGWPFITLAMAISFLLFLVSGYAGIVRLVGLCFVTFFFRDPIRMVPQGSGFILATGDGVISHITQSTLPKELQADETLYHKVSIFLNVFNVHVNRLPASGKIDKHIYIPGKFLNAALDKASEDNERTLSLMSTAQGHQVGFAQIAGFVARRIIHDLSPQQEVAQGERYGIIRFGSRCDIYIPTSFNLLVEVGSSCVGGETILATAENLFNAQDLSWKSI